MSLSRKIVLLCVLVTLPRSWLPSAIWRSHLSIGKGLPRLLPPDAILPLILVMLFASSFPRRLPSNNSQALHRSFSWGQDRSDQEHFGPFPDAFAEYSFKRAQHVYNLWRQIKHLSSLFFAVRFERSLLWCDTKLRV